MEIISLKTRYLRYDIGEDGRVLRFMDLSSGIDYAASGALAFYLLPGDYGRPAPIPPKRVWQCGGVIRAEFASPDVSFALAFTQHDDFIRMTIVDVSARGARFGRFVFGGCRMSDAEDRAPFCASSLALSLKANTLELPGRCAETGAVAYEKLSALFCSAALIGAPRERMAEAMRRALSLITIDDALVNPLGGPFAMGAPGAADDYLLVNGNTDFSNDDWIEEMRALGVRQRDFHQGIEFRQGDYLFDPARYPGGAADFRRKVSDKLHANGMLAGLHTYSGMVHPESRFVSPVPSEDLCVIGEYTLSADIGETDDQLFIAEDTSIIPMVQYPFSDKYMTCVRIGDELIEFFGKTERGLTQLRRGALGTRAASHKAGARARQLRTMYNFFQCVPGSALFYELACGMATAYNEGGFDMMYFDGLECLGDCIPPDMKGLGWYYEALFVREVLRHARRPALVEYSIFHSAIWAGRSRAGAFDSCNSGYKRFIDAHCAYNENSVHRRLMSSQLGWYELYPPIFGLPRDVAPNWAAKIPFMDDIDYLGAKALAYDSGLSYLAVDTRATQKFPRYGDFARRISEYSQLRQKRCLPRGIRERLKGANNGWRLSRRESGCAFTQVERVVARPYSMNAGENEARARNPFGAQAPRVRLIARRFAYIDESMPILAMDSEIPVARQSSERVFGDSAPLNLEGREALCVRVRGNGKDEYINIRLEGAAPYGAGVGDHLISARFTGWRLFTLCEQDNDISGDLKFIGEQRPPSLYDLHREYAAYKGIRSVRVLTTGSGEDIYMSSVFACPYVSSPVRRPSLEIGGEKIVFETQLMPGCYLEYSPGSARADIYDVYGKTGEAAVSGKLGVLPSGESGIILGGDAEGSERVTIHLLTEGETLYCECGKESDI